VRSELVVHNLQK